jgi:hypothetical protein
MAAILHPMLKASCGDHAFTKPNGALRITPPQPFELFMGLVSVPYAPAREADKQVFPGALKNQRRLSLQISPRDFQPISGGD